MISQVCFPSLILEMCVHHSFIFKAWLYISSHRHLVCTCTFNMYEGESVNRSKMESKTAVMDIIGFLCVSYDRLCGLVVRVPGYRS
jgi:hypothetical protein